MSIVYITGGSEGLGFAIASYLLCIDDSTKVTLVARNMDKLRKAHSTLLQSHPNATIYIQSADVSNQQQSISALTNAIDKFGIPTHLYLCAGISIPFTFISSNLSDFDQSMQVNYFGVLYTLHAYVQTLRLNHSTGSICIVGSVLSMFTFSGYSCYSPTKFALRSLVDSIADELNYFGISVVLYMPATILSPGFITESAIKPLLCKTIEGSDAGKSCDACAKIVVDAIHWRKSIALKDAGLFDRLRVLLRSRYVVNDWMSSLFECIFISDIGLFGWKLFVGLFGRIAFFFFQLWVAVLHWDYEKYTLVEGDASDANGVESEKLD